MIFSTHQFHVADSEGLIAMINPKDPHHEKVKKLLKIVYERDERVVFPSTVITEAITTVHYKSNIANPNLAKILANKILGTEFIVWPVDHDILEMATSYYDPAGSKKNTFFDAVVAAVADHTQAISIFSFDKWYKTLGFKLLIDIV